MTTPEGRWVRRERSQTPAGDGPAVSVWSALVLVAEVLAWIGVGVLAASFVPQPGWRWVAGIAGSAAAVGLWALFAAPRAVARTPARNTAVRLMVYALGITGWLVSGLTFWGLLTAALAGTGEAGVRRGRRR